MIQKENVVCRLLNVIKRGLLGPDSRDAIYYPNHHKLLAPLHTKKKKLILRLPRGGSK